MFKISKHTALSVAVFVTGVLSFGVALSITFGSAAPVVSQQNAAGANFEINIESWTVPYNGSIVLRGTMPAGGALSISPLMVTKSVSGKKQNTPYGLHAEINGQSVNLPYPSGAGGPFRLVLPVPKEMERPSGAYEAIFSVSYIKDGKTQVASFQIAITAGSQKVPPGTDKCSMSNGIPFMFVSRVKADGTEGAAFTDSVPLRMDRESYFKGRISGMRCGSSITNAIIGWNEKGGISDPIVVDIRKAGYPSQPSPIGFTDLGTPVADAEGHLSIRMVDLGVYFLERNILDVDKIILGLIDQSNISTPEVVIPVVPLYRAILDPDWLKENDGRKVFHPGDWIKIRLDGFVLGHRIGIRQWDKSLGRGQANDEARKKWEAEFVKEFAEQDEKKAGEGGVARAFYVERNPDVYDYQIPRETAPGKHSFLVVDITKDRMEKYGSEPVAALEPLGRARLVLAIESETKASFSSSLSTRPTPDPVVTPVLDPVKPPSSSSSSSSSSSAGRKTKPVRKVTKPTLSILPKSIVPGGEITVIGKGFTSNAKIRLFVEDEEIELDTADSRTDNLGNSPAIIVPFAEDAEPGSYDILVTDEKNRRATGVVRVQEPGITTTTSSPSSPPSGGDLPYCPENVPTYGLKCTPRPEEPKATPTSEECAQIQFNYMKRERGCPVD